MLWCVFAFLLVALLPPRTSGQLTVRVQLEREMLLLYESIPVVVSVRNFSGRPVELHGSGDGSWLDFLVADEAGARIAALGRPEVPDPVRIGAGETFSYRLNLLPLYDLRARGTYRVQALVEHAGQRVISPEARFTIIHGREIWKQTVGLPGFDGESEEYRTYSLLARRAERGEVLYVGVADEQRGLVYGMLPLGPVLPMGEPETQLDGDGNLHVLYRSGPRAFEYARVDPFARVHDRAVFSDLLSKPRLLRLADGRVAVRGGEQLYPKTERVMTEEELAPRPVSEPSKKKGWWPFGRKRAGGGHSKTNAASTNFSAR
jgi:hypothetical protein